MIESICIDASSQMFSLISILTKSVLTNVINFVMRQTKQRGSVQTETQRSTLTVKTSGQYSTVAISKQQQITQGENLPICHKSPFDGLLGA